jgi:quaternary ammonium compound-resistance protein SugE
LRSDPYPEIAMAWLYLFLAGLFEIAWAFGLKASDGFTRPVPTTLTVLCMVASFWLLAVAMKTLPLGTSYAIWTGIGTVGAFVVGVIAFGESLGALRVASVVLIVAGIVGLKLSAAPA